MQVQGALDNQMEIHSTDDEPQAEEWVEFEGSHHFKTALPDKSDTPKDTEEVGTKEASPSVDTPTTEAVMRDLEATEAAMRDLKESKNRKEDAQTGTNGDTSYQEKVEDVADAAHATGESLPESAAETPPKPKVEEPEKEESATDPKLDVIDTVAEQTVETSEEPKEAEEPEVQEPVVAEAPDEPTVVEPEKQKPAEDETPEESKIEEPEKKESVVADTSEEPKVEGPEKNEQVVAETSEEPKVEEPEEQEPAVAPTAIVSDPDESFEITEQEESQSKDEEISEAKSLEDSSSNISQASTDSGVRRMSSSSNISQGSTDSGVRRMSHMVTPPRQRKDQDDSIMHRGNSIILDITSPPDLMLEKANPEKSQSDIPSPTENQRPQGFGTPPRVQIGAKPRKPSKTASIDWFKTTRDKGKVDSLVLTDKSQRKLEVTTEEVAADPEYGHAEETVAVFNANSPEGSLTVKALSKRGCNVVAVVRVFTSQNTKLLLRLPRVTVKVADSHDRTALANAIKGADRAILVTKYWERFESRLEETQADIIIDACHDVGVPHVVFSTYEDIKALSRSGKKSQIVPNQAGNVEPSFEGMKAAKEKAESYDILLTHMMTSYLDKEKTKKSLCLLSSGKGKVIVKPYFKDV